MIKKILNDIRNFLVGQSQREKVILLESQIALLSLKVMNLEKQQTQHFQTINDLVRFQNDILKVVDFASEFSMGLDGPVDLSPFGFSMLDDDDEFMN